MGTQASKIKAIIFDCFGVFYIDPGKLFLDKAIGDKSPLRPQLKDLNVQVDLGVISYEEYAKGVAKVLHLPLEDVATKLLQKSVRNEELLNFAQSLRSTYKVGMLSNIGKGSMDRFFTPQERETFFDAVVLSSEVGLAKPQPEIFELICHKLEVQPNEAIMIDDIQTNCEGAKQAGLQTIWYEDTAKTITKIKTMLYA